MKRKLRSRAARWHAPLFMQRHCGLGAGTGTRRCKSRPAGSVRRDGRRRHRRSRQGRRRPGQDRIAAGAGRSAPGSPRRRQGPPGQGDADLEGRAGARRQGSRLHLQATGRIQYDAGYVGYPDDEPRGTSGPATSASTPAPVACGLAPKAPSRAASATSSRWTLPTATVGFGDCVMTYAPQGSRTRRDR